MLWRPDCYGVTRTGNDQPFLAPGERLACLPRFILVVMAVYVENSSVIEGDQKVRSGMAYLDINNCSLAERNDELVLFFVSFGPPNVALRSGK